MPLPREERGQLKKLYKNLADNALPPGSPFYEPVFSELGLDDPVQQLSTLIDFDGVESIRLFSGFRGSGKTTELLRLKKQLEGDGYFVLYADALNYVNAAEPIDITDLLMVLAGAFSDALEQELGESVAGETFWARLLAFLNTEIRITEGAARADVETPAASLLGGVKTGVDLKFEIKAATTFRRRLQEVLGRRLQRLKAEVDAFFEDGIRKIRKARGKDTPVVFIFDQLEQLRGTLQSEQDVIRSVELIFATHIDLLKIPYVHAVFTVPPWLKFVLPGNVQVTLLATVHLWNNDTERSRNEPAWAVFRSLIARRLADDGLTVLFGPEPQRSDLIDALIAVCGGHVRDLLRLLRDVVIRATSLDALPVDTGLVTQTINSARRELLPIARDDARWLNEIANGRVTALPSTDAGPVNRLARFLDGHLVLYFVNGDEWYDIHPLIREEVAEVMRATRSTADGANG